MNTTAAAVSLPPTLCLPASVLMPRKLLVRWEKTQVIVMMFGAAGAPLIAAAVAKPIECQLRGPVAGERALFVGSAAFELTSDEAGIVEAQFSSEGLKRVAE